MTVLSEKRCVPCEGGVPSLEKKEIDKLLVQSITKCVASECIRASL